jgi:hypothetical protein
MRTNHTKGRSKVHVNESKVKGNVDCGGGQVSLTIISCNVNDCNLLSSSCWPFSFFSLRLN